jgi:hypothetical protein
LLWQVTKAVLERALAKEMTGRTDRFDVPHACRMT